MTRALRMLVLLTLLAAVVAAAPGASAQVSAQVGANTPAARAQVPSTPTTATGSQLVLPPHKGPCADGQRMAIGTTAADLHVDAPTLIPHSKLASFSNLTQLWSCPGTGPDAARGDRGYVAEFSSGVWVYAIPGWHVSDPRSWWEGFISDNDMGAPATIGGMPGVIEEPTPQPSKGDARVFDHGWLIVVVGDYQMPAHTLLDVANSM